MIIIIRRIIETIIVINFGKLSALPVLVDYIRIGRIDFDFHDSVQMRVLHILLGKPFAYLFLHVSIPSLLYVKGRIANVAIKRRTCN